MKASRPLHIGYLVQQFPPEVGAGPARVTEMALRWREQGAEVTVITGMPNRPEGRIHPEYRGKLFMREEHQGIRVLRSWLYASPKHGFARTLVNNATFMVSSGLHALARGGGLDVLVASSPPWFPHVTGTLVHALRRVPLVLEVRDLWPDYLAGMGTVKSKAAMNAIFAAEKAMLRRAEHVVVVTESFRTRVIEKGTAPERVDVVPNGVDLSLYYASDEPPPIDALRKRDGETVVGYLGNFGAGQDLIRVLDAAALLEKADPRIRVVLAGEGTMVEQVQAHARELGLARTTIHPPIPKTQTRAFYNACDVCLVPLAPFPILQETIPSKIFEVMACERPVVASVAGEAARIVEQSGGGLVVAPGDARGIADAVLRLRDTPAAELAAMGAAGRAYVGQNYAREALAARYLDILQRVGSRRAGGTTVPRPA
jgi:glycosyltransferase involved in cell wall biosynthesis